jgi:cobalt-zinc-cadmium efflux system membrane fusion protein
LKRRAILSGCLLVIACIALARCGAEPDSEPKASSEAVTDPNRVTMSDQAAAEAGIVTQVLHPAPFAETLALPARLSPLAETPEEVEARLRYQSAAQRLHLASAQVERLHKLTSVVAAKSVAEAEAELAQARVEQQRADAEARNLGIDPTQKPSLPPAAIWALADLYDAQVPRVKVGAKAWVRVESFPSESFPGRVAGLTRAVNRQTRTLTARVAVDDPQHRLRPQEPARVEVEVEQKEALSLPERSVLFEGTARIVFVKTPGGFTRTRVHVGGSQAGRVEILDGVKEGDAVVTAGAQLLLGELSKTRMPQEED